MARGDAIFARVDISLIWDPRMRRLSGTQKWFYIVCYLSAVETRSELLPPSYDLGAIRDRAGIDPKTARKCLEKSLEVGLLQQSEDGRIFVSGVRNNHQKLTWGEAEPDSPYGADMGDKREDKTTPKEDNTTQEEPDWEKVRELWNRLSEIHSIPALEKLTKDRKQKYMDRLQSFPKFWQQLNEALKKSDFLRGKGDKGWCLSFDWAVESDEQFTKLVEGTYARRRNINGGNYNCI